MTPACSRKTKKLKQKIKQEPISSPAFFGVSRGPDTALWEIGQPLSPRVFQSRFPTWMPPRRKRA